MSLCCVHGVPDCHSFAVCPWASAAVATAAATAAAAAAAACSSSAVGLLLLLLLSLIGCKLSVFVERARKL